MPLKSHRYSLGTRLFFSAAVCCVLILVLAGVGLTTFYRRSAERGFDSGGGRGNSVIVCDIDDAGRCGGAKFGLGRSKDVGIDVPEADFGTRGDEPARNGEAQPLAAAGDDGDLAVEIAEVPQEIRGFGHVKAAAAEAASRRIASTIRPRSASSVERIWL